MIQCSRKREGSGNYTVLTCIPSAYCKSSEIWTGSWQKDDLRLKQARLTPWSLLKVHLNLRDFPHSKFPGINIASSGPLLAPPLTCLAPSAYTARTVFTRARGTAMTAVEAKRPRCGFALVLRTQAGFDLKCLCLLFLRIQHMGKCFRCTKRD